MRLRVTRRDEPDLAKLIEWVLGIAEARHRAWVNGDPDPYGCRRPTIWRLRAVELFGLSGVRERIGTKKHPGKEAPA